MDRTGESTSTQCLVGGTPESRRRTTDHIEATELRWVVYPLGFYRSTWAKGGGDYWRFLPVASLAHVSAARMASSVGSASSVWPTMVASTLFQIIGKVHRP